MCCWYRQTLDGSFSAVSRQKRYTGRCAQIPRSWVIGAISSAEVGPHWRQLDAHDSDGGFGLSSGAGPGRHALRLCIVDAAKHYLYRWRRFGATIME